MTAKLTKHAIERAGQRLNLGADSLQRLADTALRDGLRHCDARGGLRRYLDALYLSEGSANCNRIYGEVVFIFSVDTLITVLPLPNKYKGVAAKLKSRKEVA